MRKKLFNFKNGGGISFNTLLCAVLLLIVVFAICRVFFAVNYFRVYVIGTSMESTLTGAESKYSEGGDYVYAFRSSSPRRGDIVVIKTSDNPNDEPIIKRVIALSGDRVKLDKGVLYLNGEKVDEPYVKAENNTDDEKNTYPQNEPYITVPEGCMFFLGDNRDVSVDSRSEKYGMLPVSRTMGVIADWSMNFKDEVTVFNTFFDFKIFKTAGR